jgi:hypothetical protein
MKNPSSEIRDPKDIRNQKGFVIFLLPCFMLLRMASAQPYAVSWFTLDGGGGVSANGPYFLSGTIGQPDAGHLSGGDYTVDGGFWNIFAAIQTPGAPLLSIWRSGTNVVISWPNPSTGFRLESTSSLWAPVSWSDSGQPGNVVGDKKQAVLPANAGGMYFRLKNP